MAPSRIARSSRYRPRRLLVCALATALTALAPGAHAAYSQTPRLDPGDPNGAWAGYSLGRSSDTSAPRYAAPAGSVAGMDVSGHQGVVDWRAAWDAGARFAYVKASEGVGFRNKHFPQQYDGSRGVGMVRGAYHFALPDRSSGAEQAHFFVDNGGGWVPDGHTLPGALDVEHNPYGGACYGLPPEGMSRWIAEFSDTYRARTGRFPAIYTTTRWWQQCTGGNPSFGANNPLWLARYAPEPGALPAGWRFHTIWQFADRGVFPGDQNTFNGGPEQLARFTSLPTWRSVSCRGLPGGSVGPWRSRRTSPRPAPCPTGSPTGR